MGDRLLLDRALAPALHAAGLTSTTALLALGGAPDARSLVTTVELPVEGTVGRFHLKRYAYAGWSTAKGLLGRGTLWGTAPEVNEFRVLTWMRENQVPAVRPVAAAARTQRGRLVAHALLTEHVPDAVDLERRLKDPADPLRLERGLRRRVAELIGRCLQRMHSFGYVHRDVHARNILVRFEEESPRIWFLDCRRGGPPSWRSGAWHDLAMLDADWRGRWPRTDRLAALRAYLRADDDVGAAVAHLAKLRGKAKVRAWA
jgi:hypothetical protein